MKHTYAKCLAIIALTTLAQGLTPCQLPQHALAQPAANWSQKSAANSGMTGNLVSAALPVNAVKTTIQDKSRNKTIEMRVTSPTKPGTYPVIVFSHGAGGSRERYQGLIDAWAPSGYICLQPTHDDSIALMRRTNPSANILTALAATNQQINWINRGRDIKAVIDNLDGLSQSLPAGVVMDRQNIGIGGHSFGAFTTLISAGAPVLIPRGLAAGYGGLTSFAEPRARAFLVLSGQGTGKVGLCFPDAAAYTKITAPMMVMTGSKDRGQRGQPPEWRMESFTDSLHDGNKYLIYINGATHMTFEGSGNRMFNRMLGARAKGNGGDDGLFAYIQQGSLSFWDAYLKGNQKAHQELLSQQLSKDSSGVVRQENH